MIDFLHLSYILYYVIGSTKCTRDGQTLSSGKLEPFFFPKPTRLVGKDLDDEGSERKASYNHIVGKHTFVCPRSTTIV